MIKIKCQDCNSIPTIKVTEKIISIMCKCTNVTIANNWWTEKKTIQEWKKQKNQITQNDRPIN